MRLEAAAQQEAEAAAALEEAEKKLRALKADRDKTKDFEELEAQHVQVQACTLGLCMLGQGVLLYLGQP